MLQTPDGNGRLELFEYIHPDAIETEPTRPNEIGMHRVAFSVDDLDEALEIAAQARLPPAARRGDLRGRLQAHLRPRPSGIIVMLAEALDEGLTRPLSTRTAHEPAREPRPSGSAGNLTRAAAWCEAGATVGDAALTAPLRNRRPETCPRTCLPGWTKVQVRGRFLSVVGA